MVNYAGVFFDTRVLSESEFRNETNDMISKIKIYKPDSLNHIQPTDSVAPVYFYDTGTIDTTLFLSRESKHIALLNFADGVKPGGFPELGLKTQEEQICRCSNLYEGLIQPLCDKEYYKVNDEYDSISTDTIIYLSDVTIFKREHDFERVNPVKADVITCPAPAGYMPNNANAIYESRIKHIIRSAIDNNVDTLVLGAWGCGAFRQSPELVSNTFVKVLNEYSGYFKKVIFAIIPTPGISTFDEGNYSVFLNAFEKGYNGEVIK